MVFCAERIQRLLMAFVLTISLFLVTVGSVYGLFLLGFVIVMILVWGVTDFCPSIWLLRKLIGSCK